MTVPLTTLARVKAELKETSVDSAGDSYLLQAMTFVSGRIDDMTETTFGTAMDFVPRIDTRYFDAYGSHIDDLYGRLFLDQPLLEPTEVVVSNGTPLVLNTDYYVQPRNTTPYYALRRAPNYVWWLSTWVAFGIDWVDAIRVTGVWGYRTRYSDEGWLSSGDTVQGGGINASVTSITVSDADGPDALLRTPRFSPGNILLIEDEYLQVLAVNTTTNVLSVVRGIRGSTAAAHVAGTPISTWQPEPAIERAAIRWTNLLYARRGVFSTATYDGLSVTTTFPPDAPEEVVNILAGLPKWNAYGAP